MVFFTRRKPVCSNPEQPLVTNKPDIAVPECCKSGGACPFLSLSARRRGEIVRIEAGLRNAQNALAAQRRSNFGGPRTSFAFTLIGARTSNHAVLAGVPHFRTLLRAFLRRHAPKICNFASSNRRYPAWNDSQKGKSPGTLPNNPAFRRAPRHWNLSIMETWGAFIYHAE